MGPVAFVTFYAPPLGGGVGGRGQLLSLHSTPLPMGEGLGGGASWDEFESVSLTSHTPDSAPT